MAKKKLGNVNIFTGEGMGAIDTSFETFDEQLFGEIAKVDEGRQVAKPISIFEVLPDVAQARRAIPSVIRQQWNGNPHSMDDLFGVWLDLAQKEKGTSIDVGAWIEGGADDDESDDDTETKVGALEAALMLIVELAASIKRDGLTNPITVVQEDNHYHLETGERRWLAYHLLYANYRDQKWTKIPARVVEQFNVWRQATENTARADLNAIGKARQYAILMMDLWANDPTHPKQFRPIDEFPSERAYYAQISELPVPYGKSKLLLNAIGAKTPTAFNRRRKVLELPDEAWRLADDYNVAEDILTKLSGNTPDDLIAEVQRAIQIFPSRKDSISSGTPRENPPQTAVNPLLSKHNRSNLNRVWKLASRASDGATDFTDRDMDTLAKMRRWLDEVENIIQSQRQTRKK
jgi:hypothetical protein